MTDCDLRQDGAELSLERPRGKRSVLPVVCPLLRCWGQRGLQLPAVPGGREGTLLCGLGRPMNQVAVGEGGRRCCAGAQMGKQGGEAVSGEDDFRARRGNQGPVALRVFPRLLERHTGLSGPQFPHL